ncbi:MULTISPECIES: DUF190 domain-containing protein [unclassified Kosmotoga]|nr:MULTISPECIES: DUF190 domain-containing protein [unclassified Kosmotoga]
MKMKKMSVYLGEKDRYQHKEMYEHILEICYNNGIKGATVIKGIMGFGEKRHIHRNDFFTLSEDLPIVVEVIDVEERINFLASRVRELPFDGLIVIQDVEAYYVTGKK